MKFLTLLILGAACAFGTAFAATPIDERIDARAGETLDVKNVAGSIVIKPGNDREVRIRGSLGNSAERLDVRRDGDRVIVHVIMKDQRNRDGRNWEGTSLDIEAPSNVELEVEAVSASVTISGIQGEQRLSSVSGFVRTEAFEKDLRVSSVSGSVEISGRDRRAVTRANTVSGSLTLTGVSGELHAQSVSGSVEVESEVLERAELSSISGRVSLRARLTETARVDATTTSGSLDIVLGGSAAAEYRLSSFSGRIDNCFGPAARGQNGPGPGREVRFEEGATDARVSATSMSGSIRLCRD